MAVPDQQHAETRTLQQIQQENLLIDMQMEALGVNRREGILTGDYPEKTAAFVPAASIERLANLAGTKENKLALKVTKNLNAWNTAWQTLADDGTAADVYDVNEGLGQTHRIRLQKDESIKTYTGEGFYRGGSVRGGRAGRAGGRGGGFVGRGGGRMPPKDPAKPVIRTRTLKGQQGNAVETSKARQAAKKFKAFAEAKPTPRVIAKLIAASLERQSIAYGGLLADPAAFMASVQTRPAISTSSSISSVQKDDLAVKQKVLAPATDTALTNEDLGATAQKLASNGMTTAPKQQSGHDVAENTGSLASAPKVRFMIPSLAEQKAKRTMVSRSTSSTTTKSVITSGSLATTSKSITTSEVSQTVDLMDLDVGEESSAQPVIGFTHTPGKVIHNSNESLQEQPEVPGVHTLLTDYFSDISSTNRLNADQINQFKSLLKTVEAQSTVEANTAVAAKESPTKDKYTQAELVALRPGTTAVPKDLTITSKQKSRSDKPNHSLAKQMEAKREAVIGEHISKCRWAAGPANLVKGMQNLSLKDEVSATTTAAKDPVKPAVKFDPGAAARAQSAGIPAPVMPGLTTTIAADNNDEQGHAIRGAARAQKDRPSNSATGISSTVKTPVVAVRAPYGGASASTLTASSTPPSTVMSSEADTQPFAGARNQRATRKPSGPALPAWMDGLKAAADTGAASRAQYGGGNVLASVTNNAQAPVRRSKINEQGFIGMVERSKKGQDPMEKVRQHGL